MPDAPLLPDDGTEVDQGVDFHSHLPNIPHAFQHDDPVILTPTYDRERAARLQTSLETSYDDLAKAQIYSIELTLLQMAYERFERTKTIPDDQLSWLVHAKKRISTESVSKLMSQFSCMLKSPLN